MGNVALDLENKIGTVSNKCNVCYWKTISNDPYLLDCMFDHNYLKYYNAKVLEKFACKMKYNTKHVFMDSPHDH